MAFSLYLDETCLSTSCTYVEYTSGELQWTDNDGPHSEFARVYRDNNSSNFVYEGPDDLYLTTTYAGGTGSTGSTGGTESPQYEPWSFSIEYYIDGKKTTFFQDVLSEESYPTRFDNIEKVLRIENYGGTIGVIIEYREDGATTNYDFAIKAPSYVDSEGNTIYNIKYSSIGGAVIGTEYNYLNKISTLKIYFTTDTGLTYNVNVSGNPSAGGTVSKSPSKTSYNYADKVTIKAITKVGYTFNNWSINNLDNGTTTSVTSSSYTFYVTNNYNCVANFTPNKYTITYKDQGGGDFTGNNLSSLPKTHTYGTATTLVNGSKTGYTFDGWFTNSDCSGNPITSLSATGYTSNITLYAKWTIIPYTITYNLNGGTGTMTPTTYNVETPTFSLPTPTRSGYTFKGWYGNNQFSGSQITQISKGSTGNKKFWAKWEGNSCTITVNANPSELTDELTGGGSYKNGDSVTITAPAESGTYKFQNWTKNNSVVSTSSTYTFTANGNATYVANYTDSRKSALFKIHVLDDTYNETGLCEVEIKYGELDYPSQNSIKRAANRTIEIDGPTTSANSVTKKHISGTDFLDSINGNLTTQVFYKFPESINNEPFINILYNGNTVEEGILYTDNSLTFDVYYGSLPKPSTGDGTDTDNQEITVRFKYYLDGIEIDTSNTEYISWPESNINELKCYWFKYDGYTKNDREAAISGNIDIINFTYIPEYYGDPANSTPVSNLKNSIEIQAPSFTGLAESVFLTGVDINDTNKTYTYSDCTNNLLDICVYFKSYEFNAYVYSNLPDYGDAYIAQKGKTHTVFHASDIAPTVIRFNAEVLNDAFEFNRWVNHNDPNKVELSTENPWVIQRPEARDYYIEAVFTGKQINVALDPNNGKAEAFWQRVGIIAGESSFKTVSFNSDETIKLPDDRTGYTFEGWYTSETDNNGSGDLIIDKNGKLQSNVAGWTTSDGIWIKGPDIVSSVTVEDVVVYAKWKPIEYTITYKELKGATNPTSNPSKYTIETSTITFVKPTEKLPKGYTWSKWNPSSITKGSTGNKTITAEWLTNKYTLTWDLKGGTVTTAGTCAPLNSTGDSNGLVYGQVYYLSDITAPIVSKNDYNFLGWSAENGNGVITPASKMPNADIKYVAVYSTKTYTITVDAIPEELKSQVYILKGDDKNEYTTITCTTGDKITLVAENTVEYVLSHWQKSGKGVVSGLNEFTFTANDTYLDSSKDNTFIAYYEQDPSATLKINFIVDDIIEKTEIFKFNETFSFLGNSSTEGYRCEIQGEPKCLDGDIEITQEGYFFIPLEYNGKDICMVPHEQGTETTELICSNKGNTIAYDGNSSQYYADNTAHNSYCPFGFEWQAYLPTNIADETHLVFPAAEKEEYGVLYGPLVIDVYYGEIPERFLPVVPEDIEITTVSGLTLLQRIQNKIATFKWLNNLFGEPEKTTWDSYDNSGIKSFLKDDSKETPLSMHCIEYGDLQIYNQEMDNESINCDKTIKQYSFTSDATIIKPLNGQVVLEVSKIEGNKIYFNITNLSGFANTDNGIYIYFSVNDEIDTNNATLYKMKLPKSPSNKGLLLTIPEISNIETLYIYRAPIMVDSTKVGITPKIYFNYEKVDLPITVYDETTLNVVI